MTPAALLHYVASTMLYQAKPGDQPAIMALLEARLIQPIQQGKLIGYAVTRAGYERQMFHRQR